MASVSEDGKTIVYKGTYKENNNICLGDVQKSAINNLKVIMQSRDMARIYGTTTRSYTALCGDLTNYQTVNKSEITTERTLKENLDQAKKDLEEAKKNLEELLAIKEPVEFFKTVDKKREDLLDDADDTAPVFDFFKGGQKKIFEKALEQIQMFENSKTYVREQEIIDNVAQMEAIVTAKNPFSQIQKLPDMSMKFVQQYGALLEKEAEEMRPIVDDDLEKVLHTLDQKEFASVFRDKFVNAFAELKQKLDTSHEIAAVKNIRLESDCLLYTSPSPRD